MRDAGLYRQLWRKHIDVIRLLLKRSGTAPQKHLIYKHEFESTGARNKLGYIFTLELVNGKAVNKSNKIAVSFDLQEVMMENQAIAEWLKDKSVKLSVARSGELTMEQVIVQKPEPAVTEG
ncbi:MAG: hypothetical protein WCO54_08025 [Bacteroidota bacterium]